MRALIALLLLTPALVGCLGGSDDGLDPSAADGADAGSERLTLHPEAGFTLNVTVDVVLIGFENGTSPALEAQLTPEEVHHATGSWDQTLPPDPHDPRAPVLQSSDLSLPHRFTANYTVHETAPSFAEAFWESVAEHPVETDEPAIYDADAAEEFLAERLPGVGVELDPGVATLVLLHTDGALPAEHAWRITYTHGHLEPVRHFGERTSLVIHDMSARPDPYVGAATSNYITPQRGLEGERAYNVPTAPGGPDTVDALELYVRDVTHHRVLQGPAYPVSTRPCHDVSLVMAVDATTLAGKAPGWRAAEDWFDAEALERQFVNLTGDDVRVTTIWLSLPVDDPILAALVRGSGSLVANDALRLYLDQNWERFTDTRPGCEAYLSVLYFGDMTSEVGRVYGGIGMYDVDTDRRISFSVVTDARRFLYRTLDPQPVPIVGSGAERERNLVNYYFAHETGHIFGQMHPQNAYKVDSNHVMNAVESAHTVMSYQMGDRTTEFGPPERANWQHNRAGYAIYQAQLLGLEETVPFQEASKALAAYDWVGVQKALEPHIQGIANVYGERAGEEGWDGAHRHPWGAAS